MWVRAGRQSRSARTRGGGRRRTRGGRSEEDPTKLILLNGPPGIGKSTLAIRFARDHPLTLVLDIDSIRTSMGAWETHDDSKRLARLAAVEMARAHLRSGHDVVVPQLLARLEFIETHEKRLIGCRDFIFNINVPGISAEDLKGLKYSKVLVPLLDRLHADATARDRAGNRRLFYDQYACLLLLFFFSSGAAAFRP